MGEVFIEWVDIGLNINNKYEDSGFLNCNMHLVADGGFKGIGAFGNKSTGVNYGEIYAIPIGKSVMSIAGNATVIIYYGFEFAG
jgi:hypothetical protein